MSLPFRPNIILLVWDAARLDYVMEHASKIGDLRQDNVWFNRAIAPSTWSLPSHASLFTGEYPHEHGRYRIHDHELANLPLVKELDERGYWTMAVSGNGFAGPLTGFHEAFDVFHYTGDFGRFDCGMNVGQRIRELRWEAEDIDTVELFRKLLNEAVTDSHPLRSMVNLSAVLTNRLAIRVPLLQNLPHPIFNPLTQYSYTPQKNSRRIISTLDDAATPFFIFANYMDPHRPYYPPSTIQREYLGAPLSYREIKQLNEIAAPWEFIQRSEAGEDLAESVERIRSLYAGEIMSLDSHLDQLIDYLQGEGLYEDTVIVITSDHGENLGERDLLGNLRMGHEASISQHLLRVPLLLVNPAFEGDVVSEPVSLTRIFDFLTEGLGELNEGISPAAVFLTDDVVVSEYPALGDRAFAEKYPNVSQEAINLRTSVHHTVAVSSEWSVITDSLGGRLAWQNDEECEYKTAPSRLRDAAEKNLAFLEKASSEDKELSETHINQLEALGYR